jgi:GlpG protein
MSGSTIALRRPLDEDLRPLSAALWRAGVAHRIHEEQGEQVLSVVDARAVSLVQELYRRWREGSLDLASVRARRSGPSWLWRLRAAPVTAALLLLGILGFLLIYLGAPVEWISKLTFTPFTLTGGQLRFESVQGEYWRLITPVFLHFGWLHIVFNSLWLWELGHRIERQTGSVNLFGLFLVVALLSNVAQFQFGSPGLFGGLSGVVYGLLGFSWVMSRLVPTWEFGLPPAIMALMLGWLALCLFGVVEGLGFGAIANGAHVGGLLAGAVIGLVFGLVSRAGVGR